jgi:hypothetical protein
LKNATEPAGYWAGSGKVEIFSGDLGGGKTISAMRRAFDCWDQGGVVATNISINWEGCKEYGRLVRGWNYDDKQYLKIDEANMHEYHKFTPPGSLIILEEVHLFWNAREWQKANKVCLDFLTQARKYDNDIIFITQHPDNFDKQSRRIIRYFWWFTCLDRSVIPGLGVVSPFPVIIGQQLDRDRKTKLDTDRWWRDKRIYSTYETKGTHGDKIGRAERPQVQITRYIPADTGRPVWAWGVAVGAAAGIIMAII